MMTLNTIEDSDHRPISTKEFLALLRREDIVREVDLPMLKALYQEPGRTATARRLAKKTGDPSYRTPSSRMSALGKRIALALNPQIVLRPRRDLGPGWYRIIAPMTEQEHAYVMKEEFASALEQGGYV